MLVTCEPHNIVDEACWQPKTVFNGFLSVPYRHWPGTLQDHEMKSGRHKVKFMFFGTESMRATEDCPHGGQPTTRSREAYVSAVLASIKLWLSGWEHQLFFIFLYPKLATELCFVKHASSCTYIVLYVSIAIFCRSLLLSSSYNEFYKSVFIDLFPLF